MCPTLSHSRLVLLLPSPLCQVPDFMVAKALGGITTSMITTAARLSDIVGASTMTVTTSTVSHAGSDAASALARTPPPAAGKQVSVYNII